MNAALPKPLRDTYPADGVPVYEFEARGCDQVTAHPDGTLRVWRGFVPLGRKGQLSEVVMPYFPIQPIGMTKDEVERAVAVAMKLLEIPSNRKGRRHPMLRHLAS